MQYFVCVCVVFFFFRVELGKATSSVAAVCETPEKSNPSKRTAQKTADQLVVDNTMRSSCSDVQLMNSERRKAERKRSGAA